MLNCFGFVKRVDDDEDEEEDEDAFHYFYYNVFIFDDSKFCKYLLNAMLIWRVKGIIIIIIKINYGLLIACVLPTATTTHLYILPCQPPSSHTDTDLDTQA